MIERVWNQCLSAAPKKQIIVATDDERIFSHCKLKNINTIMTSADCLTGSDRLAEVSKKIKASFYVNVQGDEPLINPKDIKKVINDFKKHGITNCATKKIENEVLDTIFSSNPLVINKYLFVESKYISIFYNFTSLVPEL